MKSEFLIVLDGYYIRFSSICFIKNMTVRETHLMFVCFVAVVL